MSNSAILLVARLLLSFMFIMSGLSKFGDIAGTTVYHCHILEHQAGGMMGVIRVA